MLDACHRAVRGKFGLRFTDQEITVHALHIARSRLAVLDDGHGFTLVPEHTPKAWYHWRNPTSEGVSLVLFATLLFNFLFSTQVALPAIWPDIWSPFPSGACCLLASLAILLFGPKIWKEKNRPSSDSADFAAASSFFTVAVIYLLLALYSFLEITYTTGAIAGLIAIASAGVVKYLCSRIPHKYVSIPELPRVRGGWLETPIPESHYDPYEGNRMFLPRGNASVTSYSRTEALICTCSTRYVDLFPSRSVKTTHFGSCLFNVDSALMMRQFAAMLDPATPILALFAQFAQKKVEDFYSCLPLILAMTELDFSFDTFLRDSAPSKRPAYIKAKAALDAGRYSTRLEFFVKSNEVHRNSPSARPRNIANYDPTFTVAAAYFIRLAIKIVKKWAPGFVSGCSLEQLGTFVHERCVQEGFDQTSPYWYKADGGGFDSHQRAELQLLVDIPIGRAIFEAIHHRLDLPLYVVDKLRTDLFNCSHSATSRKGDRLTFDGTVLSGHPLKTTFGNTLRSIFYQEFALAMQGRRGLVFASGDDVLAITDGPIDVSRYESILPSNPYGIHGLGVLMQDFSQGPLHEMDFLSKFFVTDGTCVEAYRPELKVLHSGTATCSLSKTMTAAQYCAMQAMQLADLPTQLSAACHRFAQRAAKVLKPAIAEAMRFDWSCKLFLARSPKRLADLLFALRPTTARLFERPTARIRGGYLEDDKCRGQIMPRKNNVQRARKTKRVKQTVRPSTQVATVRPRGRAPAFSNAEREYAMSLHDPFNVRQVRIPTPHPVPTQCITYHGTASFTTNAAGFAQVCFVPNLGSIILYNDALHTDTNLGAATTLVPSPYATSYKRLVNAGIKVRSSASFSNEAGNIQAYSTFFGRSSGYDKYRDSPHQKLHSKGEVASVVYYPQDPNFLCFGSQICASTPDFHIGVLITGAPSLSYLLQYAFTLELVSDSNTDIIPLRVGPTGDSSKVLSAINAHNPADPSTWDLLKDKVGNFLHQGASEAASLAGSFAAGFVGGNIGGSAAFLGNMRAIQGGNRTLMLGN